MKKIIDNNENVTSNSKQVEVLKKNFPTCFDRDGKFLPEKLNSIINDEVEISNESYELNWLGKKYARLLANQEVTTMLTEDIEHNSKPENINSQNLYLEGDNLEVLKHMANSYSNQIKMIYIDPPYNTGTDFIYKDDRKFTVEELSNLANVDEEEAKRILEFTESKSNSHSAWLTFMYPRLYIARELLKDEGVIFISIDDNEQAQLKIICDEIFGEVNLVSNIPCQLRTSIQNDTDISINHEYLLCYAKNRRIDNRRLKESNEQSWYRADSFAWKPMQLDKEKFSNPDNDPRGLWKADPFDAPKIRKNLEYKIVNPNTGETFIPTQGRHWRVEEEKYKKLLQDNRIIFGKNGQSRPQLKVFYNEKKRFGSVENTWFSADKIGTATNATKELKNLFSGSVYFDTPKPLVLLKKIINSSVNAENNDIVLDFFSGSATTAHAVMELNAEDNGNRKFIMVQLPETINKYKNEAAYNFCANELCLEPIIPSIAKERIKLAKELIENKHGLKNNSDVDFSFKIFKTKKLITTNYYKELERIDYRQTEMLITSELSSEELADLLLTWKLHDGIEFTEPFKELILDDYVVHYANDKAYFMYKEFSNRNIVQLLEEIDDVNSDFSVRNLIIFALNFTSKEQRELVEALKGYKNKKKIELNIELRY